MDYDETNTEELEAELYSRIHHDKPEPSDIITAAPVSPVKQSRRVTKYNIYMDNKPNRKMRKNRQKLIDKSNPNPYAFASVMNKEIPKRLTPYTSYLSHIDSQPIDLSVTRNESSTEIELKPKEHRPNPFNQGFNRIEEKKKRLELIQVKKAHADKIRQTNKEKQQQKVEAAEKVVESKNVAAIKSSPPDKKSIILPDSDSDDEVYIYPPEEPTVISSDEDDGKVEAEQEPVAEPVDNLLDDCADINVDYDKRLSSHDDPFGGIDVAHLNNILNPLSQILNPMGKSSDHFAKPKHANRHAQKRSYTVSETDFAAIDVYESESSDLPETNVSKSPKVTAVLSGSEDSDIDTTKRSKRMRKRKSSGSNRGSDHISSDDSDDDAEAYLEPVKTTRPYYLHRGEGVSNAVTKYSKRYANRRIEQPQDMNMKDVDSSEDSLTNELDEEEENGKEKWIVTDEVGETDDIEIDLNTLEESNVTDKNIEENIEENVVENGVENVVESNADKDDDNSVRSKRFVIHPEMGWNSEMKAFYNDSWGGETHNAWAIRREMPSKYEKILILLLLLFQKIKF